MINEGLELLSKRFVTAVALQQQQPTHGECVVKRKDDLSAIEVFYASTTGTVVPSCASSGVDPNVMLVDASRMDEELERQQTKDAKTLRAAKERENVEYRERLKNRIDQVLPPDERETQPLSRYLHRYIRERATVERMKTREDLDKKEHQVYYASFSYLIDGIYPMVDGLHKKRILRDLRVNYFNRLCTVDNPIQWSAGDASKSIVGTIFAPVKASSMYEDNLQRMFLMPPFDIKETQRINPRGVLLAYMAMFAPDHDPLVDIASTTPTTLRGLFSNVLDGTLYKGKTVASLKSPFEMSDIFDGGDLKTFCDRLLLTSFYSIFLTLLGIKAWMPDRYPEDRFVINTEKFVSVKVPYNEVIYDPKDKTWTFHDKRLKKICYTTDFVTLLHRMYV